MTPRTEGRFIGAEERPVAAWLTAPAGGVGARAALIAPPLGYEYWTAHRSLRAIAERLAENGVVALRVDYDGTGDSAGEHLDPGRVAAWRASLHAGAEELRRLGCTQLLGVGLRFGAALLIEEGEALGLEELVCWAPVESGKRYGRELRMVATPFPENLGDESLAGAVSLYGVGLAAADLEDISRVDPTSIEAPPAERVLVLDRSDRPPSDKLAQRLEDLGVKVEHEQVEGTAEVLDVPTEKAVLPEPVIARIGTFATGGEEPVRPLATGRTHAEFAWRGGTVREEHVRIGESGLVGIRTTATTGPPKALVVFLDSGSEHHVGPGRAWVELGRSLACAGYDALRFDFTGWGESPDAGRAPGRPYDRHVITDTIELVSTLRAAGEERIVLCGLCSGGWIGLVAATKVPIEGVISFNPWVGHVHGETIYDTPADAARALVGRRARQRRLHELGVWELLERLGLSNTGGRLLQKLRRARVPMLYLFADGDLSAEWLEIRTPRNWRLTLAQPGVQSEMVPGLDHPMFNIWLRPGVYARIRAYLDEVVAPR